MNKVAKLQSRLNAALASKQFYEAHQILRTVHARLSAEQKFAELLEQLHSTVLIFCEAREYTSAIDLAELYVDTLKASGATLDASNVDNLLTIFSQLPAKLNSDSPSSDRRTSFLNKTLDWSIKSSQARPELLRACAFLHQKFADVYSDEGEEEQAERYARAADYLLGEVDRLLNPPAPDDETESIENLERDGGDEHKMDAEIDLD